MVAGIVLGWLAGGYLLGLWACWIAGGNITRGDLVAMLLSALLGPLTLMFVVLTAMTKLSLSGWGDKVVFGRRR